MDQDDQAVLKVRQALDKMSATKPVGCQAPHVRVDRGRARFKAVGEVPVVYERLGPRLDGRRDAGKVWSDPTAEKTAESPAVLRVELDRAQERIRRLETEIAHRDTAEEERRLQEAERVAGPPTLPPSPPNGGSRGRHRKIVVPATQEGEPVKWWRD